MEAVVITQDIKYQKGCVGKTLKKGTSAKLISELGCAYAVVLVRDGYIVIPSKAYELKKNGEEIEC